MNTRFSTFAALLLLFAITPAAVRAQAPGVVTYQGRITNNGANFTGTGEFRFVIYRNGAPPVSLWSHDNSSIGAGIPATVVSLPVTNGLFSVGMGDTSVAGMAVPIPASIFANAALRVRIWFSDGVSNDAVIADHPITSVGYALFAQNVADGSITSGKLATGAVNNAALANDVTFTHLRMDSSGTETVTFEAATAANQGGLLTLRNGLGSTTFTLDGDTLERGSLLTLFNSGGVGTLVLNSDDTDEAASLSLRMSGGLETVEINAAFGGGQGAVMYLRSGVGATTVTLDGDETGAGVIRVSNDGGAARAELDGMGASGGGELLLRDEDGTATVFIEAAEGVGNGAQIALYKAAGGTASIILDADFGGDGRITTQVLEITGGSDFSENFDIRSPDPRPGMLVRIDPANPGDLAVSDCAYDRTVAGVVSGAGGVKPGLLMGQRGSVADGKHPVALTGRVYCLVDADRGAIEPGDLITTSDTPGHGMKVGDHARGQGAIVGKAMTGLASGRGMVLLLVNLH